MTRKLITPDLPVIITEPGDYVTRAGKRVTIHKVSDGAETFRAKGSAWGMWRGKTRPKGLVIYHVTGRFYVTQESPLDIVGPWAD